MTQQETICVTGGAGFIGSHLCEELLHIGYKVVCIDNLLTGSEKNIEQFHNNASFTFLKADVSALTELPFPFQYLFHLASPASVIDYQQYPEETALANSVGTRNLLRLAEKNSARFLFASTSEIYGDPEEHPQKETYWGHVNPNGIRACYDESKRWGEMITALYGRERNVDVRIIRIFNTYGPRMRPNDGRVISNFINQAIRNEPLTVYGNGHQTRSFCFVSDLVAGILSVMFSNESGEVFNLGNPEEYSMLDLANKVIEITKSNSHIVHKDLPKDDPEKRKPDITKAKERLHWEPKIQLAEGLIKTTEYYRSLLTP